MKTAVFLAASCLAGTLAFWSADMAPPGSPPWDKPPAGWLESDIFESACYDEISRTLTVRFRNGFAYDYFGVPPERFREFATAQRPADCFNLLIRKRFRFRRTCEPG